MCDLVNAQVHTCTHTRRFYQGLEGLEATHSTSLGQKLSSENKAFISEGRVTSWLKGGRSLAGLKPKPYCLLAGRPQAGPLATTCSHFLLCLMVKFHWLL